MSKFTKQELTEVVKCVLAEEIAMGEGPESLTRPESQPTVPQQQKQPIDTPQERAAAAALIAKEWAKMVNARAVSYKKIASMSGIAELTNAANQAIIVDGRPKHKPDGTAFTLFDEAERELAEVLKDMLWGYESPAKQSAIKFWYNKTVTALRDKEKARQRAVVSGNHYDMSAINAKLDKKMATGYDARGKQPGLMETKHETIASVLRSKEK